MQSYCDLKKQIKDIPDTYQFVYYNLNPASIQDSSGKCFPAVETNDMRQTFIPSLNMKKFSQNLHTPESCKLNAAKMKTEYSWDEFVNPKSNYLNPSKVTHAENQQQGLRFTIYDGYYAMTFLIYKYRNM
jgi:hypothetical protein